MFQTFVSQVLLRRCSFNCPSAFVNLHSVIFYALWGRLWKIMLIIIAHWPSGIGKEGFFFVYYRYLYIDWRKIYILIFFTTCDSSHLLFYNKHLLHYSIANWPQWFRDTTRYIFVSVSMTLRRRRSVWHCRRCWLVVYSFDDDSRVS